MKKIKILIIVLIILVLAIISAFIFFKWNENRINSIITDESKQVQALRVIYTDFLSNQKEGNIVLDESALKNIITDEFFTEENQNILKLLEVNSGNNSFTYTLYAEYNPVNRVLSLSLDGTDTSLYTKTYKLNVKDSNITYIPSKLSNYSIS